MIEGKIKVCVVTGTRAEYGLLRWLLQDLNADSSFELQLLVTGMHLSPEFGLTINEIIEDGFTATKKVEMLLSSDSVVGISKSVGLGVIGFSEAFTDLKPDCVVVLGDRFEIFAAAQAAMIARIPIVHLHGGESTEGAIDEAIRHSITKMSQLHFTSTEVYRKRVIQLGEDPNRVFNVGALGVEGIKRTTLLTREKFQESIDFTLLSKNILVTFHPTTLEVSSAREQFDNLLTALEGYSDVGIIFTKPNADTDGRIIGQLIDEYVAKYPKRMRSFASLGHLRYLSALQFVDAVVGNSSSGIIEAPSFGIPTLDIGDRQKGRVRGNSVVNVDCSIPAIKDGLRKVFDKGFRDSLSSTSNPYEGADTSRKILSYLKSHVAKSQLKKHFFDLSFDV